MGLNICLRRRDYTDLPSWDDSRLAGDKEFAAMMADLPRVEENWDAPAGFDFYTRPADFEAWRRAIANREWPNPGRFEQMLDLLEENPDCWIYISW